jgi:hypothetical protein
VVHPYISVIGSGNPYIYCQSTTDNVIMKLQAIGSLWGLFGSESNHPVYIYTNNSRQVFVENAAEWGGRVGIGTIATGKLHVDQPSTVGAIPVLMLDQADVSEEFIRFVGTAADNDVTQSLVATADVGVATIAGYKRIYVQDDGNQITDGYFYEPFYTLAAP